MFTWQGEIIKSIANQKSIKITEIAEALNISRQTVNEWINGQVPKGTHLLNLCKFLQISPDQLFKDEGKQNNLIPLHRTRKNAKINDKIQNESSAIINEYEVFFRNCTSGSIISKLQVFKKDEQHIIEIANQLRNLTQVKSYAPMDYFNTFLLMKSLGIFVIFKQFSPKLKSYAFYTNIAEHRVVFINTQTNILDLIFPVLHESVHAINPTNSYNEEEEQFCDKVASHVQFPNEYVDSIHNLLVDVDNTGQKINLLKKISSQNKHSLFGITKRLNDKHPNFIPENIGGADTKLKKEFPSINNILFSNGEPISFLQIYESLSPLFIKAIENQIDEISDSKLAELLGLESAVDSKQIRGFLKK